MFSASQNSCLWGCKRAALAWVFARIYKRSLNLKKITALGRTNFPVRATLSDIVYLFLFRGQIELKRWGQRFCTEPLWSPLARNMPWILFIFYLYTRRVTMKTFFEYFLDEVVRKQEAGKSMPKKPNAGWPSCKANCKRTLKTILWHLSLRCPSGTDRKRKLG